jgi:hypothetical protein
LFCCTIADRKAFLCDPWSVAEGDARKRGFLSEFSDVTFVMFFAQVREEMDNTSFDLGFPKLIHKSIKTPNELELSVYMARAMI